MAQRKGGIKLEAGIEGVIGVKGSGMIDLSTKMFEMKYNFTTNTVRGCIAKWEPSVNLEGGYYLGLFEYKDNYSVKVPVYGGKSINDGCTR